MPNTNLVQLLIWNTLLLGFSTLKTIRAWRCNRWEKTNIVSLMTVAATIHVSPPLIEKEKKNFHDKMVTRAYLVQPETVPPLPPLQFQTKRIHLDQLCRTKTKLCGVTHHTGLFLLPCTYTQPPNTELPTGFLLQQPLKQKEGYSAL